jgi:hypothetical protein
MVNAGAGEQHPELAEPVEGMELPYEDTSPPTSRPSRLGASDILRVDRLQTNLEIHMELLLGHPLATLNLRYSFLSVPPPLTETIPKSQQHDERQGV